MMGTAAHTCSPRLCLAALVVKCRRARPPSHALAALTPPHTPEPSLLLLPILPLHTTCYGRSGCEAGAAGSQERRQDGPVQPLRVRRVQPARPWYTHHDRTFHLQAPTLPSQHPHSSSTSLILPPLPVPFPFFSPALTTLPSTLPDHWRLFWCEALAYRRSPRQPRYLVSLTLTSSPPSLLLPTRCTPHPLLLLPRLASPLL